MSASWFSASMPSTDPRPASGPRIETMSGERRTVIVLGSYAPSLLNFRGELLRENSTRGQRVLGCAPVGHEDEVPDLAPVGAGFRAIPLDRRGMNPLRDLNTMVAIDRLVRRARPTDLLADTIKPVVYTGLVASVHPVFATPKN